MLQIHPFSNQDLHSVYRVSLKCFLMFPESFGFVLAAFMKSSLETKVSEDMYAFLDQLYDTFMLEAGT